MPKQSKLRGFLRKEILRARLPEEQPIRRYHSSAAAFPTMAVAMNLATINSISSGGTDGTTETDLDSLFDDMKSNQRTKDQPLQTQLGDLLTKPAPDHARSKILEKEKTANNVLQRAREQLQGLITVGIEGLREEALRIQRAGLIEKIRQLEAEERGKEGKVRKARLTQRLPEPMGAGEQRTRVLTARRVSKALAGLESTPKKRRREDPEDDPDGEERLRLGKGIKAPRTEITGHWKSSIHDYFPGCHLSGEEDNNTFEGLGANDRKRLRRELAEYGEKLAKAERLKKSLEHD